MSKGIVIHKFYLDYLGEKTHAMAFIPKEIAPEQALGVFTHGYTSHKGSILNWPTRLAEEGMPSVIFDLPGHYLGNYSEVSNLEEFKSEGPQLFGQALKKLKELTGSKTNKVVLGGHSLGAMMSLMALATSPLKELETTSICVGLGVLEEGSKHLFQTPFYKSTLILREQLVSPALAPSKVFPWIDEAKKTIQLSNKRIHFISGEDDLVVGESGSERMVAYLNGLGNNVSLDKPQKLPHHLPEQASGYIKKFLKREGLCR